MRETTHDVVFDAADVRIIRTKDSGNGGQNRNKRLTAVVAIHLPTGLSAKAADRHQGQNLQTAMRVLEERVRAAGQTQRLAGENEERRDLLGSGQRGDKIRTYRDRDGVVIDHRTNRKLRLADVLDGIF